MKHKPRTYIEMPHQLKVANINILTIWNKQYTYRPCRMGYMRN